jgi:hypothetical protein
MIHLQGTPVSVDFPPNRRMGSTIYMPICAFPSVYHKSYFLRILFMLTRKTLGILTSIINKPLCRVLFLIVSRYRYSQHLFL